MVVNFFVCAVGNHSDREVAYLAIKDNCVAVEVREMDLCREFLLLALVSFEVVRLRLAELRVRYWLLFLCWHQIYSDFHLSSRVPIGLLENLLHHGHGAFRGLQREFK